MSNRIFSFLVFAMILAGCGGRAGDNGNPESTGNIPPAPVTSSTKIGDATITKTLQPGVIELAENEAQSSGVNSLTMPTSRSDVTTGKVITWKDRAYVVTAVSSTAGGGMQLTMRDASYSEVLSNLTVTGDLDMSNLDVNRLEVDVNNSAAPTSAMGERTFSQVTTLATTFKQSPCEGSVGERAKGEFSEIKCTLIKRDNEGFEYKLDIGVRNLFLGGVNVSPLTQNISVSNFSVTPFVRVTVSFLDEAGKPQNIAKSVPVLSVQIPVAATYGFVNVAIPTSLEFSLPLFKFSATGEISGKYENGSWTPAATIEAPVTTFSTGSLFKYDAKGQVYAVLGAELALTQTPHVRPVIDIFKNPEDRLLSTGVYFKKGFEGTLSLKVEDLQSKPCFTWSLQGKSGFTGVVKRGTDPFSQLSALELVGPVTSGSSGCETLGPSPGGFSLHDLACKRNADGSASITGLYSAELAPGEQITVVAWSTEYLTGMTTPNACSAPTYTFPDNRQFGIPGEYISSSCTPPDGLSSNPVSYATCHNPLEGSTRNIWTRLKGNVSSTLAHGGSVLVSYCRATTINLNGSIPPGSRPTISIDKTIPCSAGTP